MTDLGLVSLDLDRLVREGAVTAEEAKRLARFKEAPRTAGYLISVLYIIGAIAAAAGVVLLKPTAITGLIIAIVCLISGQFIRLKKLVHLDILALALGIGATAGLIGWFVIEFGETLPSMAVNSFATGVMLAMALLFRSRFLAAFVPLGIGTIIGSGGAYWHASYGIFVQEATITILVFTALAAVLWWFGRKALHADWSPMAIVAARMSFIVSNFGFWVGSLWGDHVGEFLFGPSKELRRENYSAWNDARIAFRETAPFIHEHVFAIGWAAFSIIAIALGRRIGNRFLEITGVVFLAINAFTQYFEFFEDEPWALIFGGIALVAIALGLVRWQMRKEVPAVV